MRSTATESRPALAVDRELDAGAPAQPVVVAGYRLDGHFDSRFTIDADHLDAVVGRLHAARIHTLTVTPPSLDDLFLRAYDGEPGPLDAAERGEPTAVMR